ncbi:MAG: pyridoxal 5'-phosphate synthase glutaminase subunit PdxT [Methanomassiliicoccales archaeon]|nr:pyridoxal 5'-phosphate synthase glutaminase subunit PdxT [Methanomassiliicoccales archaeon]
MKVGVISVQGAVPEHLRMSQLALESMGKEGQAISIRRLDELRSVDCLIIPGGESTTISKLLRKFDLFEEIMTLGKNGMPIMGTCAGCVLLAKEGGEQAERTGTELLSLMDMAVDRNAFGRQRESFESMLDVDGLDTPFPGVFIRAPLITKTWGGCKVLGRHQGEAVMARQDNLLALSFHPELTADPRLHQMLFSMV